MSNVIKHLGMFLSQFYPKITSIIDIELNKASHEWISFITQQGINYRSTNVYPALLNQFYKFYIQFYDSRSEYEKDIWDFRKIPGTHITKSNYQYLLNFTDVPSIYRKLAKRYIKYRSSITSWGTCYHDLRGLSYFFKFIYEKEPLWNNLKDLTRGHVEEYLSWYKEKVKVFSYCNIRYLNALKQSLDYIQLAEYPEAPKAPVSRLFFEGDIPLRPTNSKEVKYIPEGVLLQLENYLEFLSPAKYIPIVLLLRATGWRISDILNLRYDKCIERTAQGWYLCGDIQKTQVLNHRIPITNEVQEVVSAAIQEALQKSNDDNNPHHLLFAQYDGKRKGWCIGSARIRNALNKLAQRYNIVDDNGELFHFGNHAFRHTKAVELINNGMNLLHIQKWMAHVSPEMTLVYAKILDTTMRKSWEEATRKGLFRIDEKGRVRQIEISENQNEDLIEWEYIRHNLDAVRMPLGYCMKPKKQDCHTQLNPCLTCRNLCTTPDFIPQYELEIQEIKAVIERGKAQNRSVWVEKNQALLQRHETILAVLKDGKTHHKAGKKGREYVGEERSHE